MPWKAQELDRFVSESDILGGPGTPGCQQLWADFEYEPSCTIDQGLDPFGEAYVAQQITLYEEIAGHQYNVEKDEKTSLDVQRYVNAINPYDHPDPAALAVHLQRLSRALRYAQSRRDEVVLDMGCGWGLSSELAAYLGLKVIAIDVNLPFVQLVNERATRGGRRIVAHKATFGDFQLDEQVDIALFYECLHHAVRPWVVASRIADALKVGGRMVLAGEPINHYWWSNWGLRLDPISVYCIRKFGWFESGWSIIFIQQVMHQAGLVPRVYQDSDPDIGYTIVAEKPAVHEVPAKLCSQLFAATGCLADGHYLIFVGSGGMVIPFPRNSTKAVMKVINYCSRGLRLSISNGPLTIFKGELRSGPSTIELIREEHPLKLRLDVERWVPAEEQGSPDTRVLGLHLESICFL